MALPISPTITSKNIDALKSIDQRSTCPLCNKYKAWYEAQCKDCTEIIEAEIREKKHQEYLDKLSKNSVAIRLRHIEDWIYKHEQNHPSKEWRMR